MKKILALVLVVLMSLSVLVACGKAAGLEGCWKGTVNEQQAYMQFNGDGKGKVYFASDEGAYFMEFTWKDKGDKLELTMLGQAEETKYKLDGDTLTLDGEDLNRCSESDLPKDAVDIQALAAAMGADSE